MTNLLLRLGIPTVLVILVAAVVIVVWEAARLIAARRTALADADVRHRLDYLDRQLADFYLPLRERLLMARGLFNFTQCLKTDGVYDNKCLGIVSEKKNILRTILVTRVFLPLNLEMERLILDRGHHRDSDDQTNYGAVVAHLALWRAMEESLASGQVSDYDGSTILRFPAEEADRFHKTCAALVRRRSEIRRRLLRLRDVTGELTREGTT